MAAAVVGLAVGVALMFVGLNGFSHASDTRTQTHALRRQRAAVDVRTRTVEHEADAPIGRAEKVATSVSAGLEASDALADATNDTNDLLSRAVDLANNGDIGAAHRLYSGDGRTSVQRMNDELTQAVATVAAAQLAIDQLHAGGQ
jgi:hypothetical protein